VLIVLTFNLWRSIIRQTFERLGTKQRIHLKNEQGDLDQEYRAFLDEYQADLLSTRRYIVAAIFMVGWVILIWSLVTPYVSFSSLIYDKNAAHLEAVLGLIIFDVPLAFFSFFFPLWCIHREMVERKEAYEDIFGDYLSQLEKKLWAALRQKNLEDAKALKEEIEIAQVINPDIQGYPSWPFDRRILLIYLLPQALPILGILLPLFL